MCILRCTTHIYHHFACSLSQQTACVLNPCAHYACKVVTAVTPLHHFAPITFITALFECNNSNAPLIKFCRSVILSPFCSCKPFYTSPIHTGFMLRCINVLHSQNSSTLRCACSTLFWNNMLLCRMLCKMKGCATGYTTLHICIGQLSCPKQCVASLIRSLFNCV